MSKRPPVHELEFLNIAKNHRELTDKLDSLAIGVPDVLEYACYICQCWFNLAEQHLDEGKEALKAGCSRSVFSRSYYAAYNASKAMRYLTNGFVSLNADDHKHAAADLPDDLPNADKWAENITLLYEHRLRADYDNWADTAASESINPGTSIKMANEFVDEVRTYVKSKFGISL